MAGARTTCSVGRAVMIAWLCGCGDAASSDPGLDAWLRVDAAQFVPGSMPKANGGPAVASVRVPHNALTIGTAHDHVSGTLVADANAVAIGRDHDAGYWIVRAGVPNVDEPDLPSFRAVLGIARDFPLGPFTLLLRAVDRRGRFGPLSSLRLSAISTRVEAELVVRLRWDSSADLDLHVVDAEGVEIWARNINSSDPVEPGAAGDAGAWQRGGILDIDSNASCAIDGRDQENVAWIGDAPSGSYAVRVATASLCGEAAAHWTVEVLLRGKTIGSASGLSVATDTRKGAGAGAGLAALTFVVP